MSNVDITQPSVLLVDDDESLLRLMTIRLQGEGYQVQSAEGGKEALRLLNTTNFDVVLSDLRMPGIDGLSLFEDIMSNGKDVPVILMTAHGTIQDAVEATQRGVFGFLTKPIDHDELRALLKKAVSQTQTLQKGSWCEQIITRSLHMEQLLDQAYRVAQRDVSVLISGASGTGKELLAKAIHKASKRANKAFVAINCGALPENLLESELFGHAKGAFTGAVNEHNGLFKEADGGTLFLDEIGDMPIDVQTRLLRVLADGQFYRVGGHQAVQVDVRIIAATHQNLEVLVQKGTFREDLFHRLNVIRVHLPPLSQRREDIAQLANHFLTTAAKEIGVEPKILTKATAVKLANLPWPGNVRQLENTCRWLTVMASGQEILPQDLPPELLKDPVSSQQKTAGASDWQTALTDWIDEKLAAGESDLLTEVQPEFERILLETALRHTQGHKQEAAKRLGWGRNTLTRKLKELSMD